LLDRKTSPLRLHSGNLKCLVIERKACGVPEEEGGFTVRVPSLPEIVTYGRDETEALAMAEDAIRLVLEDAAARGESLPIDDPVQIREVTVTLAA
jgi:antitoxin HicB